jgi:hypothetical protein
MRTVGLPDGHDGEIHPKRLPVSAMKFEAHTSLPPSRKADETTANQTGLPIDTA